MNAGKDVYTLMREVTLPPALQVGEGYGMVRWNIRAIWENLEFRSYAAAAAQASS